MGTFPAGSWKRVGGWQIVISFPVYSSWNWCSTGRVGPSFIFIFPFVKSRQWGSRADPWACAPVEQRAKWEWKIVKERPQTRSRWCVFCGLHCFYKWLWSVAKSCVTPWDPMDCRPPGSSVLGFPRQEYCRGLPFSAPGIEEVLGQWNYSVWCYAK